MLERGLKARLDRGLKACTTVEPSGLDDKTSCIILAMERLVGDDRSVTALPVSPVRVLRFRTGLRWRLTLTLFLELVVLDAVDTRFVLCPGRCDCGLVGDPLRPLSAPARAPSAVAANLRSVSAVLMNGMVAVLSRSAPPSSEWPDGIVQRCERRAQVGGLPQSAGEEVRFRFDAPHTMRGLLTEPLEPLHLPSHRLKAPPFRSVRFEKWLPARPKKEPPRVFAPAVLDAKDRAAILELIASRAQQGADVTATDETLMHDTY